MANPTPSEEEAEKEAYKEKEAREKDGGETPTGIVDEDLDQTPSSPSEEQREEVVEEPEPIPAGGMNLKQASKKAMQELSDALGKTAEATTSISREGENWKAVVEVVDEVYLPDQKGVRSMNDMVGVYEVSLSAQGELLKWTRVSSRKRGEIK